MNAALLTIDSRTATDQPIDIRHELDDNTGVQADLPPAWRIEERPEVPAVPSSSLVSSHSRWYNQARAQLKVLARLPVDWDDHGVAAPNHAAITSAMSVLEELDWLSFPPTHIDPSTDEGVCISFEQDGKYGDVECFNSGEILAVIANRGDASPTVWEVENNDDAIRQAIGRIRQHVSH